MPGQPPGDGREGSGGVGSPDAGAFLAGLLLVDVVLLRAPEPERSTGITSPTPPHDPDALCVIDNEAAGRAPGPRIAIVVDDLGYDPCGTPNGSTSRSGSPYPFYPTALTKSFAASARTHGFGVILHIPMESEGGVVDRTEPFLLRRGMTSEEIAGRFARMAADVPQANGRAPTWGRRSPPTSPR